jgi:Ca2+ transporting ATPase
MVTGDNLITARAIARDVGIIKEGDGSIIMEGITFSKLIGGVVCKNCRTKICDCVHDAKQAAAENKKLRIDSI